jgi:hypothetical protein
MANQEKWAGSLQSPRIPSGLASNRELIAFNYGGRIVAGRYLASSRNRLTALVSVALRCRTVCLHSLDARIACRTEAKWTAAEFVRTAGVGLV